MCNKSTNLSLFGEKILNASFSHPGRESSNIQGISTVYSILLPAVRKEIRKWTLQMEKSLASEKLWHVNYRHFIELVDACLKFISPAGSTLLAH
jgi:hypothetical protein